MGWITTSISNVWSTCVISITLAGQINWYDPLLTQHKLWKHNIKPWGVKQNMLWARDQYHLYIDLHAYINTTIHYELDDNKHIKCESTCVISITLAGQINWYDPPLTQHKLWVQNIKPWGVKQNMLWARDQYQVYTDLHAYINISTCVITSL